MKRLLRMWHEITRHDHDLHFVPPESLNMVFVCSCGHQTTDADEAARLCVRPRLLQQLVLVWVVVVTAGLTLAWCGLW